MLTPEQITEYQKSCLRRACVVGYEGQSLCANCNADLIDDETHVCAECAKLLLEGEASEIIRRENDG
ncbi:protein NinF [Pectobacterium aroidearum]|uniref:protein NinF n=1 Tax=Pectobacterium aroidearum TaxID=1201031 RepID=UPI003CC8BF8A